MVINCLWCGNEFYKTRSDRKYCSRICSSSFGGYVLRNPHLTFEQACQERKARWDKVGKSVKGSEFSKPIDNEPMLEKWRFFKRLKAQQWRLKQSDAEQLIMWYADEFYSGHDSKIKNSEEFLTKCVLKLQQKWKFKI